MSSETSNLLIVSSDCHAGALPATYDEYMPARHREAARAWWVEYVREMLVRDATFFDQEATEAFVAATDDGGRVKAGASSDDAVLRMLTDESNPFAPRTGEFDVSTRLKELDGDGVAGEVIFPQMPTFGGDLLRFRTRTTRELVREGCLAYNRWLADLCNETPGRHAGVAMITVDDIDLAVRDVRDARESGLFGGVLLPITTGDQPWYHEARYEPLWSVCEEMEMPIQLHSGWSPDYGDSDCATAMYISEVTMWAQRPFAALLWSGALERHPDLKVVFTEAGCLWVVEALRNFEEMAGDPLFAHFCKDLSHSPREYFDRQCFMGASFMPRSECERRDEIGVDKLMWGTDYPHFEGTWPNTMSKLNETFFDVPEEELRNMLGRTAADVYGFDLDVLGPIVDRVGPTLDAVRGA